MSAATYAAVAEAITDLVRRIPADAWDGPGLGEWDLRSLVGHVSRSFVTVSTYLGSPAERADLGSAVDYVVRMREYASTLGAADVVERGRQAGRDLGDDPASSIAALASAALADVAAAGDPLITVIGGLGIRLSDYLPTRTFELAVHGLDVARAAGVEIALPAAVLEEAAVLATRVGVALGSGDTALLALTGRAALPAGFSVV